MFEIASSSIAMSPTGRSWVITVSTLGELGPLGVGETNSDTGVGATSDLSLDTLGSSPIH